MAETFNLPNGPLLDANGNPTQAGIRFLQGITKAHALINAAGALTPLDGDTTAANVSAKVDAIITALKAD